MYWVIQEDLHHEEGLQELARVLERVNIPHSFHKVVPFVGEIIPEINPPNPVIAIGAYSMINYARRHSWFPGVFSNGNFDFQIWSHHWHGHCLNDDAQVYHFAEVPEQPEPFFMRPVMDSKEFAGAVFDYPEYLEWRHRVVDLREDTGTTLKPQTPVLICASKEIMREYRLWVVDHKIVTASLYKIGSRVVYDGNVDDDVILFGTNLVTDMPPTRWVPDRAFVLDIALTPDGFKIIEINCLNAAGLYAANVGKLVEAIENMGYNQSYGPSWSARGITSIKRFRK